jgi:hypothetical protein
VLTSSDVYRWCKRWQAREFGQWERWSIVRILDVVAERVGRAPTIGRPWIWRLKAPAAEQYPPRQIEIIGEIGRWPILPILQTMAGALNPEADKQRRSFRCVNVYKARRAGAGISISRVRSHLAQT